MKILFIARLFYPHVGGVEKHVLEISKSLIKKGNDVTVITEKYNKKLKKTEEIESIKIIRLPYPKVKYIGLMSIWLWSFKNRKLIKNVDIVHCHDVFIWYLPFRILYPHKKVFITVHGFEWDNPLSKISLWQKRLAVKLSTGSVGVGKFLEKYLNIDFSLIIYGAASKLNLRLAKDNKKIVYVGRLEENTGLLKFIDWLNVHHGYKVDFCGDGKFRKVCENYGIVHGFVDPIPFYKRAKYCVPGGYLAALEALAANCELKLFWNNKVKEDYWKMSPFGRKDVKIWAKKQTWDKLTNEYLDLYNSI